MADQACSISIQTNWQPTKPQLIICSSTATGITKNANNDITVIQHSHNLVINGNSLLKSVSVYSVSGKGIYRNNAVPGNELSNDSSQFPVGMYIIHVRSENITCSQKLIRLW